MFLVSFVFLAFLGSYWFLHILCVYFLLRRTCWFMQYKRMMIMMLMMMLISGCYIHCAFVEVAFQHQLFSIHSPTVQLESFAAVPSMLRSASLLQSATGYTNIKRT